MTSQVTGQATGQATGQVSGQVSGRQGRAGAAKGLRRRYHRISARIGTGTAALLMVCAPFLVFLALPPFQIGVWFQSEPVAAGLHGLSALCALSIAVALWGGSRLAMRAIASPLVVIPLALAVWSLLVGAFFHHLPGLSWFGTPQQGEGIAWYLDLAVLTIAGRMAWRLPRIRRWIALAALVALIIGIVICLPGDEKRKWSLYRFQDYFAFHGLFTTAILLTYGRIGKPWHWLGALMVGLLAVIVSGNQTAVLLGLVVPPLALAAVGLLRRRPMWLRGFAVLSVVVMPLIMIAAVSWVGERQPGGSLWSRWLHYHATIDAIGTQPLSALSGRGWGHYADILNVHLPVERINFVGIDGIEADWDAVRNKTHYHSHHFLIEGLLSAGIVGLLLAWAYPAALVLTSPTARLKIVFPMALLMVAVLSAWFQLPGSVPLMALAVAGLGGWSGSGLSRIGGTGARATAAVAAITAAALALSAWFVVSFANRAEPAAYRNQAPPEPIADGEARCAAFLAGDLRGGVHLTELYLDYVAALQKRALAGASLSAREAARLDDYICVVTRTIEDGAVMRLRAAALNARADLAFTVPDSHRLPAVQRIFQAWPRDLALFLERAPKRTDIAWKYFTYALGLGQDERVLAMTERILARRPLDPVGLWYSGLVLIADPARRDDGFARMNRALDHGIDRILPVTDRDRAQVRQAAP